MPPPHPVPPAPGQDQDRVHPLPLCRTCHGQNTVNGFSYIWPIEKHVNVRQWCSKLQLNKIVLLRERKRHTARRVASPWPGGGGGTYVAWESTYLSRGVPTLDGGTYLGGGWYLPWPDRYLPWLGGTYLGQGTPTLAGGYLPWPGGVPILAGVPPPPPPRCGETNKLKLLPFPILRMRAVINICT